MKKFVCMICGYVHEGNEAPEACPQCKAPKAKFQEKMQEAFRFLKGRPEKDRYLFINAWNEWTEGSYIEPDMKNGYGYLEAVKAARIAENCL